MGCADGSAPLQPEQPLVARRLSTQHHGSNHQGRGCLDHLHEYILHKKRWRPKASPKGLLW